MTKSWTDVYAAGERVDVKVPRERPLWCPGVVINVEKDGVEVAVKAFGHLVIQTAEDIRASKSRS
jgi:hypothetical protein